MWSSEAAKSLAARTAGPMPVDPHLFLVLGATGDLMKRKLLPALRELAEQGHLNAGPIHPNVLVITLQPNEGFDLQFDVKALGQLIRLEPQELRFRYAEAFAPLPGAYETLLLDIMLGDQTLFVSAEWVEASWRRYTPLLEQRLPVHPYPAGTWGPTAVPSDSWPPLKSERGERGCGSVEAQQVKGD